MTNTDILPGITLQVTPRPKTTDDKFMKTAMLEFYTKNLKSVLGDDWDSENVDEVVDQLVECYDTDAYIFARNLDRDGWDMDYQICDALDGASGLVRKYFDQAQKDWYAENPFPLYAIGTKVKITGMWHPKKDTVCFINNVNKEKAMYHIADTINSSSNYIVNHENLEIING